MSVKSPRQATKTLSLSLSRDTTATVSLSLSLSLSLSIRVLNSMMMASNEDRQSNLLFELCSLLFTFLRSPHLALPSSSSFSSDHPPPPLLQPQPRWNHPARRPMPPVTPAAFASLLLGALLALMICGSVTFVIGFILMPWVLGIVMLFYFLGILSNVTGFWMALFCPIRKEFSAGQLFSKRPFNLDL